MSKADDYNVIPVKFSSRLPGVHEVFIKVDTTIGNDKVHRPRGRTLFIANIPPWMMTKDILYLLYPSEPEQLFIQAEAGPHKPMNNDELLAYCGFRVAYAVFKDKVEVTQIMTRRGRGETVISKDRGTEMVGLRRWTDEYARRYVPPHELEETVAHAIAEYKQRLEDEKRKAKALEEPDEDGWVTVTKHSKRPVIPRTEAIQNRVLEREKAKDSKMKLDNFYAFQAKRTKLDKLQELRRKFEEDKRKVALMKAQRKFRPT
ncbi:ribosomal RNA-processing protein 7 homolog A-like [Varroa jacobsoni]|uniref:ribosomal RNA-processing protein 7 homolog A-like n=1 Tax=Varroa jacobsoni TaxID=62625 RepID=UPI000BF6239D|nr:ribosomal RNA-processing protein 7 homolog A-like [Varroa jacobsoni]